MSLEQAILDRLEKRNAQIAQLQGTIQALERAADAEREHARQQLAPLIEENKKLAARIDDSEVIERRERLIKSLNDEITKRDNELREIDSASKAHREALQAKEDEIQEWLAQLERARQERDAALLEVARLRAEVPLESTREALKNAVAKLQEVTTDRDRLQNELAAIYAEANKSGYCNGDPVAQIKKGQQDHDAAESMERQLEAYSSLSNARAHEIARLNAKLGPLEKLYEVVKKHVDHGAIIDNIADIYDALAETAKALSQLTA